MMLGSAFIEEIRERISLAAIVGRRVRLMRSGRQMKGCCPFHGEKTPSFYVYNDHYHCFGCGAHGDVIDFLRQIDNRQFIDVVEELAIEAGLKVPRFHVDDAKERDHRNRIYDILEMAKEFYSLHLHQRSGQGGLAYLSDRGLSNDSIERFNLGWAPEGRNKLSDWLVGKGFSDDMVLSSGLIRISDTGNRRSDLFFNRLIFPIFDSTGKTISFGGRCLGRGQPKYLNGPETEVFSKRRQIFGLHLVLKSLGILRKERQPILELIVVEGYMDVISLHQAGFLGAVAPLGTALTSEQLNILWRVAAKPILCFDGDDAGRQASLRAIKTALPLVKDDKTLLICLLPPGSDPDSLVRKVGASTFSNYLKRSLPMVEALFELMTIGLSNPTPEERASLKKQLSDLSKSISNRELASEYRATLMDRFYGRFRSRLASFSPDGQKKYSPFAGENSLKAIYPAVPPGTIGSDGAALERVRLLLLLLLYHPQLYEDVEQAIAELPLPPELISVRMQICEWASRKEHTDTKKSGNFVLPMGLKKYLYDLERYTQKLIPLEKIRTMNIHQARKLWWHYFGFQNIGRLENEIRRATIEFAKRFDAKSQKGLIARKKALDDLLHERIQDTH